MGRQITRYCVICVSLQATDIGLSPLTSETVQGIVNIFDRIESFSMTLSDLQRLGVEVFYRCTVYTT